MNQDGAGHQLQIEYRYSLEIQATGSNLKVNFWQM